MLKFFIPLLYTLETRYARHSFKGFLLLLAIYLIPQFLLMYCFAPDCGIEFWILSIVLVIDLYEIGYLLNDTEWIKVEKSPTSRLLIPELTYYEVNKWKIYVFRLALAIALSCFFLYNFAFSPHMCGSVLVLWLLLPLYVLYFSIRNICSLLLLTVLTSYRCILPVAICMESIDIGVLFLAYLTYPFPTIIQQSVMGKKDKEVVFVKKYLLPNYSDRYFFRVKYYAILSFCVLVLMLFNKVPPVYILLPIYYLIIRTGLFLISERRD